MVNPCLRQSLRLSKGRSSARRGRRRTYGGANSPAKETAVDPATPTASCATGLDRTQRFDSAGEPSCRRPASPARMPHDISLITTIAAGSRASALVFGFLAARLKLPPLVGYLLAGIVIGPATPGFVADAALAGQLAEIGVMLLMFGVGLHFSLDDLLAVRKIALPGALLQIAVATALGIGAGALLGLELGGGAGVRPGAVGGQHRGAAARAGGARRARHAQRPHRGRLAGRRGPGDGAGAGAAAGARRLAGGGDAHGADRRRERSVAPRWPSRSARSAPSSR